MTIIGVVENFGECFILVRLIRLRASLLEQLSASAGSFLFFIYAARVLGPSDFGLFALHLVAAQIVHSVAVQWILLPITTTPGGRPPSNLSTSVVNRLLILIVATPPFAALYAELAGASSAKIIFVPLVTAILTALVLFDVTRYFAIRCDKAALQASCNMLRWLTSFVVIACGAYLAIPGHLLAIGAFVGGILVSLLVSGRPVFREFRLDLQNQNSVGNKSQRSDGVALLSLGLANAIYTLISSSALARSSLSAFGAIQTFRSLVNWAPLILQYLETHFASTLAREGKTAFMDSKWILMFLVAFVLGEAAILKYGNFILIATVGAEFVPFNWLFAVMYALVLVQSYTRTVGIEVRLSGALVAIWMQVVLIITGAAAIAIGMTGAASSMTTVLIVSVLFAIALLQAVAMALGLRLHKRWS